MDTYRPRDPTKRSHLPRVFLHNTFSIPSNSSGNYEGDTTMFRHHSTPSRRHLTFRADSDEEFSDTSTSDERRLTIETLRNRLFLYELSPETSKIILKNPIYQKLVQLMTIIIFLIALIWLSAFGLVKQAFLYLFERRRLLYDCFGNWIRFVVVGVIGFCGYCCFYCQT